MGIITKQSIYNIISIGFAFMIGAVNMLFLYPSFPGKEFQGLIIALLANSNLIQPFISFGVQHTLIKFFSDADEIYKKHSKTAKNIKSKSAEIINFKVIKGDKKDD